MVSSTLCPAVHILGSQNVYSRAEGIADHYWPWAVFFRCVLASLYKNVSVRPSDGWSDGWSVTRYHNRWKWTVFHMKIIGRSDFDICECAWCAGCAWYSQARIISLLGLVLKKLRAIVPPFNQAWEYFVGTMALVISSEQIVNVIVQSRNDSLDFQ